MTARLLTGAPVADAVFAELAPRIEQLIAQGHRPGLGTVLVGGDPASAGYVNMKMERARSLGFASPHLHLGNDATQADVVAAIRQMNDDPSVDAMLVQHPTPKQIDFEAALLEMDPDKDVDGLHPVNVGRLALGMPGPVPCTPAGIEALLAHHGIAVAGQEVCILGRGTTLGRPLALLLTQKRPTANAAVTVVHTGVVDWDRYTRRAAVVVAAVTLSVRAAWRRRCRTNHALFCVMPRSVARVVEAMPLGWLVIIQMAAYQVRSGSFVS